MTTDIAALLGDKAESLLGFNSPKISKDRLQLAGPDFVDRVFAQSDRNNRVLGNLTWMYGHGRLGGTGYMSILPVDQGIEHSGGASFAKNPDYFDPEKIIELAIEGGCNAVASTFGVLGMMSRKYAHKIPFLVKINHNELLTYPNSFEQILFGTVEQAYDMGAAAPTTWARPPSARPSTSARTTRTANSSRSRKPSPSPTNSAWRLSCGATSATRPSKKTRTTTSPRT